MDESTKAFSKRNTSPAPTQQDDNDDGLALEILEEDLTCVVCRYVIDMSDAQNLNLTTKERT